MHKYVCNCVYSMLKLPHRTWSRVYVNFSKVCLSRICFVVVVGVWRERRGANV